ncbi:MAG: GFA family protein [Caulobacteraceae bacterium]
MVLADLTITGQTKTYRRPTESGSFTTGYFCPECGTRILHVSDRNLERGVLKAGSLDDTSGLQVSMHIFTESKQDWLALPDDVPQK